MKKNLLLLPILLFLAVGCSKSDDNAVTPLTFDNLQPVNFANNQADITLSTQKTGYTQTNPATANIDQQYLVTVQKSTVLTPLSIVSNTMFDIIYPGSILRGSSFLQAKYDPLVLKNPFNPIVLSLSLRGGYPVSTPTHPVLSEVRLSLNSLLALNKDKIDYSFVPAVIDYKSEEITTEESFKKALDIHADVSIYGGMVKAKFGYNSSTSTTQSKHYVMVSLRQFLYNASIDPKHYSDWITGDINVADFGTHEPLYISSVDYGRIAYLLLETTQTAEEAKKMITASVEVATGYASGGVSMAYNEEMKKAMSEKRITVMISGGPADLAAGITSYEGFVKFVQMPTAATLVQTSVPISYKVRRLKDNTEVEVGELYTETHTEWRSK